MTGKIVTKQELVEKITALKVDGKKIVATSGCFDIIHAGHVTYLEEAKRLGDCLVILLNSDASVKALKGDSRPINTEAERAIVIAGLASVDYVCIFSELTPCEMYEAFQPDIVAKGGDYAGKHIPEMDVVEPYGGCVKYLSLVDNCSTTDIINKIQSND